MPTPTSSRIVWPGGHNAVRAVVHRRGSRRWVVEMSHRERGVCSSAPSVKLAWRKALRFMLDPHAGRRSTWRSHAAA